MFLVILYNSISVSLGDINRYILFLPFSDRKIV